MDKEIVIDSEALLRYLKSHCKLLLPARQGERIAIVGANGRENDRS